MFDNEIDDDYVEANDSPLLPGECSEDWVKYIKWLNDPKQIKHKKRIFGEQTGFTNNQHRFGEFLFKQKDQLMKIGDLNSVFISILKYLKQ